MAFKFNPFTGTLDVVGSESEQQAAQNLLFRGHVGQKTLDTLVDGLTYDKIEVKEYTTREIFKYYNVGVLVKMVEVLFDGLGGFTIGVSNGDLMLLQDGFYLTTEDGGGIIL